MDPHPSSMELVQPPLLGVSSMELVQPPLLGVSSMELVQVKSHTKLSFMHFWFKDLFE